MGEIMATCKWCGGSGRDSDGSKCQVCYGHGSRIVISDENNKPVTCAWCKGSAKEPSSENMKCQVCYGVGWAGIVLPKK